jgi:ligand-binding sensor domain-containing protein
MKKLLLIILFHLLSRIAISQTLPGNFYITIGSSYNTYSYSPCAVDSSFYTIRYGGVERYSTARDTVDYLWNRFYDARAIKAAPSLSMALLKNNKVYRYFPSTDSMTYISATLPATVADVDASRSMIWAAVAFDEIGRYQDTTGWQVITLGASINPSHILAQNDSCAYVANSQGIWLYKPSGISSQLYTFTGSNDSVAEWSLDTLGNAWIIHNNKLLLVKGSVGTISFDDTNSPIMSGDQYDHVTTDIHGNTWVSTIQNNLYRYRGGSWGTYVISIPQTIQSLASDHGTGQIYIQTWGTIYVTPDSFFIPHSFGYVPLTDIKAVGMVSLATPQGIFNFDPSTNSGLVPTGFHDTSTYQYADAATCFMTGDPTDSGYGTPHGVFETKMAINNAALPDSNINYLYSAMGSYYIGTNKGLCIYNQVVYTIFDTSNSALPSNKRSLLSYLISLLIAMHKSFG